MWGCCLPLYWFELRTRSIKSMGEKASVQRAKGIKTNTTKISAAIKNTPFLPYFWCSLFSTQTSIMANNNPTLGELLHSLNNDVLKNKILSIEKLNKKIVNIKNGIRFNEACIKDGLHPKFANIHICIYIMRMTWIWLIRITWMCLHHQKIARTYRSDDHL